MYGAKKNVKGPLLGRVPIGWFLHRPSKKLIPNEYEQNAIRYIKEIASTGLNSKQVAERVNCWFGNLRGRPWSARTVRRILARQKK